MESNNQNTNMGQRWSWSGMKTWQKVVGLIIVILIICGIFDGGDEWKGNNQIVNTITVTGKGEVIVKPDIATVSFGVTAENMDVSKAQTESATKINDIIDFLKESDVDEKDIKTTNYNIYPRYNYVQPTVYYSYSGGTQVLAGYVVSQTVEVKIRDISKAGEILSGVGKFGVTDVSGLNFTVDKQDDVRDQARDLAIQDAKEQAKVLAKALDVRLVTISSFSENGNYPMYYEGAKVMGMGGSDAAVSARLPVGENTITSNVVITYEIK
jgi:uncharacterized protein